MPTISHNMLGFIYMSNKVLYDAAFCEGTCTVSLQSSLCSVALIRSNGWPAASPTGILALKLWIMAIISALQTKKKKKTTFNRILNIAETHFFRQRTHQVNAAAKRAACKLLFMYTQSQRNNMWRTDVFLLYLFSRQTFPLCVASVILFESHRKILSIENIFTSSSLF